MNRYVGAIVLVFSLVTGSAGSAIAQTTLNQQLIGTWSLVSIDATGTDGTKTALFGPNPKGILIFASDGHFTLVNARADLPKLASSNRARVTPDEAMAVALGSLAYFGTYSVSEAEKIITVRIEGSTYANQIGTVQKRLITAITEDRMTFTNPAATSGGAIEAAWSRQK